MVISVTAQTATKNYILSTNVEHPLCATLLNYKYKLDMLPFRQQMRCAQKQPPKEGRIKRERGSVSQGRKSATEQNLEGRLESPSWQGKKMASQEGELSVPKAWGYIAHLGPESHRIESVAELTSLATETETGWHKNDTGLGFCQIGGYESLSIFNQDSKLYFGVYMLVYQQVNILISLKHTTGTSMNYKK